MVKGVSRRVVVVKPDNGTAFEQTIFIVRDGCGQDVMREACAVAEHYARQNGSLTRKWKRRYTLRHLILSAFGGAAAVGCAWLFTGLFL